MSTNEWGFKISRQKYNASTHLSVLNKRFFQLLSTDGCLLQKELSSSSSSEKKFFGYTLTPDEDMYDYFGAIKEITIANGGSGYTPYDLVDVVGGDSNAKVYISEVNASGVATDCFINMRGSNYEKASGVATIGGGGSGFTINITSVTESESYRARPLNYLSGEVTYLIFENPL
jgi:hypothetical protein